jgi:hypothetical protein
MFGIVLNKMNEESNLDYLEINVTGKTVLFIRVEPKTLHKLKPKNHTKGHDSSLIRPQFF